METLNKFMEMISNVSLISEPSMQGRVLSVLVGRKKEAKVNDSHR